jgi:hypothetical protein
VSDEVSGTVVDIPNLKLSITSPGEVDWLAMFTRPIRSVVETKPKKVPLAKPGIVKEPRATSAGLNIEIRMFPVVGPGKTSNATAFALVNVRFNVEVKDAGPKTLLGLPITPVPSTAIKDSGDALYTTPGKSPPSGKHSLAAVPLSGPVQFNMPAEPIKPDSKVSTGSPGAAAVNAANELNVTRSA